MSFFTPPMLWFAMGGLIPVIIHLLHRQRYQKVRWAAMEFLLAALRKTQRRIRFENLLLLLSRIAIMVLLALAIARPMLKSSALGQVGDQLTHTVLVIDNSYSMGFKSGTQNNFFKAKAAAKDVIDKHLKQFRQSDRISLLTMSSYPEVRLKRQNDKVKVKEIIDELPLSDYGTSMLQTAVAIKKLLDEPDVEFKQAVKSLYIITDLQRNSWILETKSQQDALKALLKQLSGRNDVAVYLIDVGQKEMENYAAVDLRMDQTQPIVGGQVQFAAEIFNYSILPVKDLNVTFFVDGQEKQTKKTVLNPNAKTEVQFSHTFDRPGPHTIEARLDPDAIETDDRRYAALDVRESIKVLAVDGDPPGGPNLGETYYYHKALDPFGQGTSRFAIRESTRTFLTGEDLTHYDMILLANVTSLPEDFIPQLEKYVADGGGLFITLGANVEPRTYNDLLWKDGKGLLPAKLGAVEGDPNPEHRFRPVYTLTDVRTGHKLFNKKFNDKMLAALRSCGFNAYYATENAREDDVLLRFQDNAKSPALIEKTFGEGPGAGHVLLLTSTIDADWTNFQGRNIYVPFLMEITRYLAERTGKDRNLFIGESIAIRFPIEMHSSEFLLTSPSGLQSTIKPPEIKPQDKGFDLFYPTKPETVGPEKGETPKEGEAKVAENLGLQQAGFYVLKRRRERPVEDEVAAAFASNLPPRSTRLEEILAAEGNLERLAPEDLTREFPDFKVTIISERATGSEKINVKGVGSDIWRQILYAILGLMLAESLLALFFGRRKQ